MLESLSKFLYPDHPRIVRIQKLKVVISIGFLICLVCVVVAGVIYATSGPWGGLSRGRPSP